ncbi:MAG: maleylpyruvate isomerase N-terminal domain-containing protein [Ilumatobacteraceae bacterium]
MDEVRELDRDVELAARAHQSLLAALDDGAARIDVAGPSRLPGWTRGHLLTHLARNADSHRRLLDAAGEGQIADQYHGGADDRAAEIEGGAARSIDEQIADVRRSIWALEGGWAASSWEGEARVSLGAVVSVRDLPFRRLRETALHHVDLDIGYELDDLPADYVRLELRRQEMSWRARRPMGMGPLPRAALEVTPTRRLGWLTGRAEIDGLAPAGIF